MVIQERRRNVGTGDRKKLFLSAAIGGFVDWIGKGPQKEAITICRGPREIEETINTALVVFANGSTAFPAFAYGITV